MDLAKRLLLEPLTHFIVLGGLIFAAYSALSGTTPAPSEIIVIGPERIAQLAKSHQSVWRRPPTAEELSNLINEAVREEVYYREAIALGLDRNDTVIRRRLRQKMEFLTVSGAELLKPSAGELDAHLTANEKSFQRAPQIAFEQIFLGETTAPEDIMIVLKALQTGAEIEPASLVKRSLLPAVYPLSRAISIDGSFGKGFFEQLSKLSPGIWSGPVVSAYGNHLIRIHDHKPGYTPALEEIHQAVFEHWKAEKARSIQELQYQNFRKRYVVEVHQPDKNALESQ